MNTEGRQVFAWRPFAFHTMGQGSGPQGLSSFHPAPPHRTRARRAGHTLQCPGRLCGWAPRATYKRLHLPFGSSLADFFVRGKERPTFSPMKRKKFGPVTLRIAWSR
uniref:Uncharacterized protein n=1 Tax=Dulem virus 34 TaxID=3145752 RepID=A0AAU8B710_9CAUD